VGKFITSIPVSFITVLLTALTLQSAWTNPLHPGPHPRPSYGGFAEIDPNKNHFIIVGDTQSTSHWEFWRERNGKERKSIVDEITKHEPAFVIHLGDLTAGGGSKKQWKEFDNLHQEFRERKIPYFPILGNHEFYGNDKRALQNYFGHFPHLSERRWYSFIWKNIGFISVDSNFSTLTRDQNEQQTQWYLRELEKFDRNEKIDYIIVCCHEPPFTNSRVVDPNEKVKAYFADPFVRIQKTSLFFSGHNHSYERFRVDRKFFIVSGGGGGPRHRVTINPETSRYYDLFGGPELRFFHFVYLQIRDNMIIYNVHRLESNGTFTAVDPITISRTE
jgi:3',5'-cyclic AMP phosphodiesterase CpdA